MALDNYRQMEEAVEIEVREHERLEEMRQAHVLDEAINRKLDQLSSRLAAALLDLGQSLHAMHVSGGYKLLGYKTWETYLENKQHYGRSYLSYILKLGQAGDLSHCLPPQVGASQLIEYAKHTDYPERIPQLVADTWPAIEGLTIRKARYILKRHVAEHADLFKKPLPTTPSNRRKKPWRNRFQKLLDGLPSGERHDFLAQMEEFLNDCRLVIAEKNEPI